MTKKKYTGGFDAYEDKLARVMARFEADKCSYDWTRNSCYVEVYIHGQVWRFENSIEKSAANGRKLTCVSDLFAEVVLTLEDLARATEKGLVTLDMLLQGIPALPAASQMEDCFRAMGFAERPTAIEQIDKQYRLMAKALHPDAGGDAAAFAALTDNYKLCKELL